MIIQRYLGENEQLQPIFTRREKEPTDHVVGISSSQAHKHILWRTWQNRLVHGENGRVRFDSVQSSVPFSLWTKQQTGFASNSGHLINQLTATPPKIRKERKSTLRGGFGRIVRSRKVVSQQLKQIAVSGATTKRLLRYLKDYPAVKAFSDETSARQKMSRKLLTLIWPYMPHQKRGRFRRLIAPALSSKHTVVPRFYFQYIFWFSSFLWRFTFRFLHILAVLSAIRISNDLCLTLSVSFKIVTLLVCHRIHLSKINFSFPHAHQPQLFPSYKSFPPKDLY